MTVSAEDLERRLFQLEALYEIGRECARLYTLPDVLRVILSMLIGSFGAMRGLAFAGDTTGRLEALHALGLTESEHLSAEALARNFLLTKRGEALDVAEMDVCLSFDLNGSSHGAIALGPRLTGAPYTDEDRALLEAIVANASPYLHKVKLLQALEVTADELRRKVQALTVANELALSIASRPSERHLHRFLLERVAGALNAVEGALGLRGENGWIVGARYLDGATPLAASEDEVLAHFAGDKDIGTDAENGLATPIRYGDELVGMVWLRRPPAEQPFSAHDRELLEFLTNQAAVMLETSRLFEVFLSQQQEQFRLRAILEQYLSPTVAERLVSGSPTSEGTRLPVSVLMVDMRGSTQLINHIEPELMVQLLNQYFGRMTDVLFHYEGTIDKFGGDSVLGFFGAPESHHDDPLRAVRAAAAMHRAFTALLEEWRRRFELPVSLGIGIGIATGDAIVGNIGSAKRLEHTIIGPTVNLAARLTTKAPAGTIQIDAATWSAVAGLLEFTTRPRPHRPRYIRAKGFKSLIPVYRLRAAEIPTAPFLSNVPQ